MANNCCVLNITRNIFGRPLLIVQKIDLQTILGYPLTAVPLSLSSFDGIKHSTNKVVIAEQLKIKISSNTQPMIRLTQQFFMQCL